MSEAIVCPICETENSADATHCEVCGERLVPAEPGEEVAPEESVAEHLSDDGNEVVGFAVEGSEGDEVVGFEVEESDPQDGDEVVGFEVEESEPEDSDGASSEAGDVPADGTVEGIPAFNEDEEGGDVDPDEIAALEAELAEAAKKDAADEEEPPAIDPDIDPDATADVDADAIADQDVAESDEDGDEAVPDVLYSSLDGTAYAAGTPEYEEGFGPMGEELVAEPPAEVQPVEAAQSVSESEADHQDDGDAGGFEDDYDEYDYDEVSEASHAAESGQREPSPAFKNAFKVREKERPVMEPLPQPGTFSDPATVTVYVNREPVLRHDVEGDETLIGRKDPVADAYPDIDLTEFDAQAHVSRKHAYIYRQNKNYTLYAVSNAGTQLNSDLLELGDRRPLSDGDVIVIAGKFALKFELP